MTGGRDGNIEAETGREDVIKRLRAVEGDGGRGAFGLNDGPVDGIMGVVHENAVAHEFGVESAVVAVVDLLGHETVVQ